MNEAELLFGEILNCDRLALYQNRNLPLEKDKSVLIACALKRRINSEPIQYILGKAFFMGLEFRVNSDVLIPRPETELLAEAAIGLIRDSGLRIHSILDVGTGSGCIAVALAKNFPDIDVSAVDVSEEAIGVARQNVGLNEVKVSFFACDLFPCHGNFDLVVSNPPYIPTGEIANLQPEVRREPGIALDGGSDGLKFYRRLAEEAPGHLKEGGFLIFEIGYSQREEIENIFQKSGKFEIINVIKDYNDIDRVVIVRKA